jgi:hypothetical protein
MDDVVEKALRTYGSTDAHSRVKITLYLQKLNGAGQSDRSALAEFGVAYLKEMHEGPDRRYSGC